MRVLGMARSITSLRGGLRPVDETELALLQALARRRLLELARLARLEHRRGREPRHDAHAVVVADHHVAGIDEAGAADDRNVHRAERLLHRALRVDRARPDREAHGGQVAYVADAGVDDQAT